MALTEFLILRKPRSGCLEERTGLIQPIANSFTPSQGAERSQPLPVAGARPAPGAARRCPDRRLRAAAIHAFREDPAEVHRSHPCAPRRRGAAKRVDRGAKNVGISSLIAPATK